MNFVQQSPTRARGCGGRRKRIGDDERQSRRTGSASDGGGDTMFELTCI